MQKTLATIYVEPVPDKIGYELRNTMIDLLDGPGTARGATYRLKLGLTQTTQGVALQNNASITRYNDTLKVTYTLTDTAGKVVATGIETGLSAYNVLPQHDDQRHPGAAGELRHAGGAAGRRPPRRRRHRRAHPPRPQRLLREAMTKVVR